MVADDDQGTDGQDAQPLPNRRHAHLSTHWDASPSPLQAARPAMKFVCLLLTGFTLLSLACFVYQFFHRISNDDDLSGVRAEWSNILGHLIRGAGFGLVTWRLAQYAGVIENQSTLEQRHITFWRTSAWVVAGTLFYAGALVAYTRWQEPEDKSGQFRPEFQSRQAAFRADRIEFRRASREPVDGYIKMQKHNSEEQLFVAPAPEVTGADVAKATVQISEIFPGIQGPALHVKFTQEGARKMEKLTKSNQNRPLAVLIDGKLRGAPTIFSVISADAQLSGVFTLAEAERLIDQGGDR